MSEVPDTETLNSVSLIATRRLSRFAIGDSSVSRSFLFADNRLTGVRFRAGVFFADWLYGEDNVRFFRGDRQIDDIVLDSKQAPVRRAA